MKRLLLALFVMLGTMTTFAGGTVIEHSDSYLYLQFDGGDSTLIAIPQDYINGDYTLEDGRFTATLISGKQISYTGVAAAQDSNPYEMPAFQSYKFNNKFNYQVFTDVIAEHPEADLIELDVAGIGKRLTASFQFASDRAQAWVGDSLQQSKKTRQRFENPVTYLLTYSNWRQLEIVKQEDGTYKNNMMPFGREVTVSINWLTDHSTNQYQVPEIYIVTSDGKRISSKTTYKDATFQIKGGSVFPDMEATAMQIKGRGNTSWSSSASKNPYHIKFPLKQKPFGLTAGKNWILLANKLAGSMTTNAIGHKIASLMDAEYPCHIVPVELYINNKYQGSYNFCEKVKLTNNNVDIDNDSTSAMMEMDIYTDEGKTINYDNAYGMAVKINDPDVEDADYTGPLTYDGVFNDFNTMTQSVASGGDDFTHYIDTKSLVNYLATCEMMRNGEINHPKSVFCYSENVTDAFDLIGNDPTPWKFGPLWDCDWGFGYHEDVYFINSVEKSFFQAPDTATSKPREFWGSLRYNSTEVDSLYFCRWDKFINNGGLDELIEFCDDYYQFANMSLSHNNDGQYATDNTDYATTTTNSKNWLKTHAWYVYNNINHYIIKPEPEPEPEPEPTGIDIITSPSISAEVQSATIYSIQGTRLTHTQKGLNIIGGRKVFVR